MDFHRVQLARDRLACVCSPAGDQAAPSRWRQVAVQRHRGRRRASGTGSSDGSCPGFSGTTSSPRASTIVTNKGELIPASEGVWPPSARTQQPSPARLAAQRTRSYALVRPRRSLRRSPRRRRRFDQHGSHAREVPAAIGSAQGGRAAAPRAPSALNPSPGRHVIGCAGTLLQPRSVSGGQRRAGRCSLAPSGMAEPPGAHGLALLVSSVSVHMRAVTDTHSHEPRCEYRWRMSHTPCMRPNGLLIVFYDVCAVFGVIPVA